MATLPAYFQQNPDVAAAYQQETYGLTPQEFADTHFALYGQAEQRAAPAAAVAPATITPAAMTPTTTTSAPPALPTYFTQNPDVAASYLVNNYGLTPQQFADTHYTKFGQYEQRISPTGAPAIIPKTPVTTPVTTPGTTPFANATQGFAQNFQNYQSIPIGAQYNPNVVGGTGSPYSQIMGQMRPAGPFNPYMNVASNTPMGGYNPGLYEEIAQAKTAASLAGGDTYSQGGMVNGLFGPNPPGPDDGAGMLDRGEYVIKKSAVNKYGRGLLDMINEGKVPAKKIKSLLD
jgi:hypothetical protein